MKRSMKPIVANRRFSTRSFLAPGHQAVGFHHPPPTWNVARLLIVLLLTGLLAACGFAPEPQALLLGEPVWQSGERSLYRITNREDRQVGNATFVVDAGADTTNEGSWTFSRQINDVGVTEQVTVEVQSRGYLPFHSLLIRTEPQGQQMVEADYAQAQVDIALTNRQGATVYERVNIPSDVRDERTLLPLARTLPLQRNYAANINSFLPITGQTERYSVHVVRNEEVTVPAGTFDAWLVELKTAGHTTRAWIAVDAPHPIVKFVEGRSQGTFELIEFELGGSE